MYNRFDNRITDCDDSNILELRAAYPNGLHFVVGDTHGECATLQELMKKIIFDPAKDHVTFVGDYNEGGNVHCLLSYIAQYYQDDYSLPGFHLIRGNHERELNPQYTLDNLPDIIVIKNNYLDYFIVHAGMVDAAFDLILEDMDEHRGASVYAYKLADNTACYDAPLRQVVWSMRGTYSQSSHWHIWPSEEKLLRHHACVVHGHTPCPLLRQKDFFRYGDRNLFWSNQRILFSEDLQSFNLDSNVKGRFVPTDDYRGLTCICLEAIEEAAEQELGRLTIDGILNVRNGVFGVPLTYGSTNFSENHIDRILSAKPKMKLIYLDDDCRISLAE